MQQSFEIYKKIEIFLLHFPKTQHTELLRHNKKRENMKQHNLDMWV